MQSKFISNFSCIHSIWKVLLICKNEQHSISQFILQHPIEFKLEQSTRTNSKGRCFYFTQNMFYQHSQQASNSNQCCSDQQHCYAYASFQAQSIMRCQLSRLTGNKPNHCSLFSLALLLSVLQKFSKAWRALVALCSNLGKFRLSYSMRSLDF